MCSFSLIRSIRIPITSTNVSMKRLYESQTVLVRYLADEIPPEKKVWVADNECEMSQHYDIHTIMMDVNEKNMQELKLTPPIVVAWVYYLARSITEGILSKYNNLSALEFKDFILLDIMVVP